MIKWSGNNSDCTEVIKYELWREILRESSGENSKIAEIKQTGGEQITFTDDVTGYDGYRIRYAVIAVSSDGRRSERAFSNYVRKIETASCPNINAPAPDAYTIYSVKPKFLITLNAHKDGIPQKIIVNVSGKYTVDSELDPQYFSSSGYFSENKKITVSSPELEYGEYTLKVFAEDQRGSQSEAAVSKLIIEKIEVPVMIPKKTLVSAEHLNCLNTRILNMMRFYGLEQGVFNPIISGKTNVFYFPDHIFERWIKYNALISVINWWDTAVLDNTGWYGFINPPDKVSRPRAIVVLQLYRFILTYSNNFNTYRDLKGVPYSKLKEFTSWELRYIDILNSWKYKNYEYLENFTYGSLEQFEYGELEYQTA